MRKQITAVLAFTVCLLLSTFTFHLSSIAPLDNLYFSVYSDLTTDQVNEKGENIK